MQLRTKKAHSKVNTFCIPLRAPNIKDDVHLIYQIFDIFSWESDYVDTHFMRMMASQTILDFAGLLQFQSITHVLNLLLPFACCHCSKHHDKAFLQECKLDLNSQFTSRSKSSVDHAAHGTSRYTFGRTPAKAGSSESSGSVGQYSLISL